MSFLSKFKRQSPEEKFTKELLSFEFKEKAVDMLKTFKKYPARLIFDITNQLINNKTLDGLLIGKKGWYLPKGKHQAEKLMEKLDHGSLDLSEISKEIGLSEKRVMLLLEKQVQLLKLQEPAFSRKGSTVFTNTYLIGLWQNVISGKELEEGVVFSELLSELPIDKEFIPILETKIREMYRVEKSDMVVGSDGILRLMRQIKSNVLDEINAKLESNKSRIEYEFLAELFGLSSSTVAQLIMKLIEEKELDNIVNYPIEEYLTSRDL